MLYPFVAYLSQMCKEANFFTTETQSAQREELRRMNHKSTKYTKKEQKKLLFICSQKKLRSPTAEAVFSEYEGLDVESAGLNNGAEVPVSIEAIEHADIIFVMEKAHKKSFQKNSSHI